MANQYDINNKAEQIAGLLDQGQDQWAANLLRQEAQQMGPNDFRALVTRTNRLDDNQVGANLVIYDGGEVRVSGNNGDQYIARLDDGAYRRQNRIHVDNRVPAGCYYENVPIRTGSGSMEQAAVGALINGLRTGSMQGALYGLRNGMNGGGVQYQRQLICPEQNGGYAQPYYQQPVPIYQPAVPIYHHGHGYLKR